MEINRGRRDRNERARGQRRNAGEDDYNRMENEGGRGGPSSQECTFLWTLFFICLLLPMRIFSLVLVKTEPTSACLDDDMGGEFTIRSWIELMSIFEFLLICSLCSNADKFGILLFLK